MEIEYLYEVLKSPTEYHIHSLIEKSCLDALAVVKDAAEAASGMLNGQHAWHAQDRNVCTD